MRRFIQFVGRLYPASWRRRYGIEFAALLEDVNPDWQTFLNVLRGAVEMQMLTWNFGKILAVAGMAGALVGLAAWFAIPNRYASQALLKIVPSPLSPDQPVTNEVLIDYVNSVVGQSMSRSSLTQIIHAFKLYQPEQAKTSLEDIVGDMKKDITIRPVGRRSDKGGAAFCVQFIYNDPAVAQRVAQELAARLLDTSLRFAIGTFEDPVRGKKSSAGAVTIEMLDSASLPKYPVSPKLSNIVTAGAFAGIALGALLVLVRRSTRPVRFIGT